MVQRSPSHFQTGTFYWAHVRVSSHSISSTWSDYTSRQHEKLCVIDQAIAFMGGLDMCFGRWDTPQHVLVDDPDMLDFEVSEQVWPGQSTGFHVICGGIKRCILQARTIATAGLETSTL